MSEHKAVDIVTENMTLGKDHLALLSDLLETQKKLTAERDAAQKACSEMRDILTYLHSLKERFSHETTINIVHALSSDCGKGYKSPSEIKAMLEPTIELLRSIPHAPEINDLIDKEQGRIESLLKGAQ